MRKPFDKKLYEENDCQAREIAKKIFKNSLIDEVVDNTDQYGVDLILKKNKKTIGFVECEIKNVWNSYEFPYENVQFPARKKKFAKAGTFFLMVNNLRNRCLVVKAEDLLASPLKEVPNIYLNKQEFFFQVPLDKVKFIDVK